MIAKCKVEPKNIQEIEAALRFLQSDCFLQPCFRARAQRQFLILFYLVLILRCCKRL